MKRVLPQKVAVILLEHFATNPSTPLSKDCFSPDVRPVSTRLGFSVCGGVALALAAQKATMAFFVFPRDEEEAVRIAARAGIPAEFTRRVFKYNDSLPEGARPAAMVEMFTSAVR